MVAELQMPTAHALLGYLGVATMLLLCFFLEAAIMQGLTKPTCTSQKSSWNVQKGIKTTLGRWAKFCLVDAWSWALFFTGEASFSSRFFFNNFFISVQIQKPTKY